MKLTKKQTLNLEIGDKIIILDNIRIYNAIVTNNIDGISIREKGYNSESYLCLDRLEKSKSIGVFLNYDDLKKYLIGFHLDCIEEIQKNNTTIPENWFNRLIKLARLKK